MDDINRNAGFGGGGGGGKEGLHNQGEGKHAEVKAAGGATGGSDETQEGGWRADAIGLGWSRVGRGKVG